ncbi:MAG: hypothetical protein GY938_00660, partial [Ketobacter sp.]|nr:hypothetical protein [Ketobacter sp.]
MNKMLKSVFTLIVLPLLMLVAGCDSGGAFSKSAVTLERIDISASSTARGANQLTLPAGNQQTFDAVGYYSDGSSRPLTDLSVSDWTSSDEKVGMFEASGTLTGVAPGMVSVQVTKDGITSNTLEVEVTNAVITDIIVTPALLTVAKGQTEQLTATAIYSDGTSLNVSSSVTWTPVDTNIVTVSPEGMLSGVVEGTTTVTATQDGITSNTVNVEVTNAVMTEIVVTPALITLAKGQLQPLTATAIYSDGSSSDVSSSATWAPVDTNIVTVSAEGTLSGVTEGTTTVTATQDGITSNTVNVEVTNAVITDITVTPATVNVAQGQTQQLTATAIYSDGTSGDV